MWVGGTEERQPGRGTQHMYLIATEHGGEVGLEEVSGRRGDLRTPAHCRWEHEVGQPLRAP